MHRVELLDLIKNGENSGVEFKRDDCRPEKLANLNGGHIILGVEDDGQISGIQRPNLEEWIMDTVFAAKVHPMLLPFYEEVVMDDTGKRVAIISFPQGISKPYVLRLNKREEIYIRVGSASRRATREQQARLFAIGGMLHTEMLPVSGTSIEALDLERLHDYLSNVLQDIDIPESKTAWTERLCGLGFMIELPDIGAVCTIAGLVLFGYSPRRFLRQAGMRVMVFHGDEKEYSSVLDETLDGPLIGLWKTLGQKNREIVSAGVSEKFVSAIRPFISHEKPVIDETLRREREWLYPIEAIRELIINALGHRDWTRSVDIEVAAYSNRMEIISPGAMQNSMTIEKMIAGQRSPRNPLIVEVLRDYGYAEARGMGVRKKVIPLMRSKNGTEPLFEATDDYLKTTLFRPR